MERCPERTNRRIGFPETICTKLLSTGYLEGDVERKVRKTQVQITLSDAPLGDRYPESSSRLDPRHLIYPGAAVTGDLDHPVEYFLGHFSGLFPVILSSVRIVENRPEIAVVNMLPRVYTRTQGVVVMNNGCLAREITVHPVGGMQLSEGYIRTNGSKRFVGSLPGLTPSFGDTIKDVLTRLEKQAKVYYGDDVVVEIKSSGF